MKRFVIVAVLSFVPSFAAAQSIPRTADGKPDFSGVWAGPGFTHRVGPGDTDSPRVTTYDTSKMSPFKAGGQAFMDRKATGNEVTDDPTASCLPNGLTRQILSPYAQQWIQASGTLVILYEYMHFFRVIPLNGRPHSKDVESTWMGDSVAKWEGDTLVIDTVGLKEWMLDATHDSHPDLLRIHSDQLHFIERLRYIDPTTVSYQTTIDDPQIFTAPWSQEFQMKLHPTWKILEFVCEENNRCLNGQCKP
jgi:hypothetical protein